VWIVPPFAGQSAKIAYYVIILVLYSMLMSAVTLPISALAPELTTDYDERTSVMTYRVLALSLMGIVGAFLQSQLIGLFYYTPEQMQNLPNQTAVCAQNITMINGTLVPIVNQSLGYFVSGVGFAVFAVPWLIAFFFIVPEKTLPKKKRAIRRDGSIRHKTFTKWESFKTMITNRGFVCVTLMYLCSQLAIQFVQNNLILYIKYVLNREEWFSYILLVLLGMACVSLPVWERLSRRFGKSRMYLVGAIIDMVCFLLAFFNDMYPSEIAKDVMIWFIAVVAGFALGALFLIPTAMLPDAITQDQLRTGIRREGIFYAFFILFQKLALALAVAVSNFILSASGYISPEESGCAAPIQPEATIFALSLMVGIAPCIILGLSLIALWFYPVTKEVHNDTLKKLDEERERNALITTDGEMTMDTSAAEMSFQQTNDVI
jgi:GPH family glycoside/pentoside/hexuronide:cation symporter